MPAPPTAAPSHDTVPQVDEEQVGEDQVQPEPVGEAALGAASSGVWTRRAALEMLSEAQVRSRLRSGTWQAPWPGVYADAGYQLDARQRAWAAVLASGGEPRPGGDAGDAGRRRVVAVGRTAARWYGWPLVDDDDPATGACERVVDEVAVHGRARSVTSSGPEVRRLRRHRLALRPGELVEAAPGLWLTTPVRTVLDCAVLLTPEAAICLADAAVHSGAVEADELADAVSARARHPRVARLREVVARTDGRAESAGETLTRLLLLPHLPGLTPQVRLWDSGRLVARFDLADEDLRLAVEHDGRAGHEGRAADDQRRDRLSGRQGWTTERVTWFQVRRQQPATVARVVETARRLEAGRLRVPGQRRDGAPAGRAAPAR